MNSYQKIPIQLLHQYEVKPEMLLHDSVLHGPAHMMRVFILQELIAQRLQHGGVVFDHEATRWAASVHDIGRVHDGDDLDHGRHSAELMRGNAPAGMSPESIDTATYIVHWHTPEDSEAPVITTELKILKDADGLDRVRLGDFNESYLRTDAAKELIETAHKLYEASFVNSQDTFQTVLQAATTLNLTKP